MTYFILAIKQKVEGKPQDGGIEVGYLAEDGIITRYTEHAKHFKTAEGAAKAIPGCDYEGCELLAATVERHEVDELRLYKTIYIPEDKRALADDILRDLRVDHPWLDLDVSWETEDE